MAPICVNGVSECVGCLSCQKFQIVCDCCEEEIKDGYYYEVHGDIYCKDCVDDLFRKDVNL